MLLMLAVLATGSPEQSSAGSVPEVSSAKHQWRAKLPVQLDLEVTRLDDGRRRHTVLEFAASHLGIAVEPPLGRALLGPDGRVLHEVVFLSTDLVVPKHAPIHTGADILETLTAAGWRPQPGVAPVLTLRADARDQLDWVWRVEQQLRRDAQGELHNAWLFVMDRSGAVREGVSRVRSARARAFARNPALDPLTELFDLPNIEDPATRLQGAVFDVRNCVPPKGAGVCILAEVAPNDSGDFDFPAPDVTVASDNTQTQDLFAAASVYVHADKFRSRALALGFGESLCTQSGQPTVLVANYRGFSATGDIWVSNAAYTGDCELAAVFGQGARVDWGYDGDVIYHELTHGLIEAGLGAGRVLGIARPRPDAVVNDAGALGEGIADFMAAVVAGDPDHAEYVAEYGDGQGRSVANELRCPEDLRGEIHHDGQIFSGALWDAYLELGEPLVEALPAAIAMLSEDATFEDGVRNVEQVLQAQLGSDAAAVFGAAAAEHGIVECPRVVDIADLETLRLLSRSAPGGSYDPMRPPSAQVRVDVPAGVSQMRVEFRIDVETSPGWDPSANVDVLVRAGAATVFTYERTDALTSVDANPNMHIPGINAGVFEVEVTPGEPVFLAFFTQGFLTNVLTEFEVTFSESAQGTTMEPTGGEDQATQGTTAASESDAPGCACGVSGQGARWLWACLFAFGCARRSRGALPTV